MCAITEADVDVVRRAYAALAGGDMDELEQCFAPDAVWHEPGENIYSGDWVGWPEIRDELLALLGPLSRGAFRAELVDVAVGQEYVVAVHRARVSTTPDLGLPEFPGLSRGPGSTTRGLV